MFSCVVCYKGANVLDIKSAFNFTLRPPPPYAKIHVDLSHTVSKTDYLFIRTSNSELLSVRCFIPRNYLEKVIQFPQMKKEEQKFPQTIMQPTITVPLMMTQSIDLKRSLLIPVPQPQVQAQPQQQKEEEIFLARKKSKRDPFSFIDTEVTSDYENEGKKEAEQTNQFNDKSIFDNNNKYICFQVHFIKKW